MVGDPNVESQNTNNTGSSLSYTPFIIIPHYRDNLITVEAISLDGRVGNFTSKVIRRQSVSYGEYLAEWKLIEEDLE